MNVFVPFRRHSLNTVELRRSSKLLGWVTYVIIRRQTTSNRVVKSSPAHGHGKQTLTPSNCNKLSSHCRSDYFGSTKIVSSNSFGQNKIGHEFCLPKTDSSNFTFVDEKPTYFVQNLQPVRRHRKVSIPASLVSNNIKLGFHVVVPQLQHPNSQARRLLGGHGCKNHDIPNSQFSKTCKCSDQNGSLRFINPDVTDSRNHKIAQMSQNHEITKLHIFQCHSWNNYDTFQ